MVARTSLRGFFLDKAEVDVVRTDTRVALFLSKYRIGKNILRPRVWQAHFEDLLGGGVDRPPLASSF